MKMYIANCTKQPHMFIYRLPEDKTRMQRIKELSQVVLSGDLNIKQIEAIIQQHARYGMVPVESIDRTREFSGLCYSIDKKVPASIMMKLLEHNRDILIAHGKENRQNAAVALNQQINENIGGGLQNLEVEIIEDVKGNTEGGLAEGIRVTEHTGRDNELVPRSERERKPQAPRKPRASAKAKDQQS